MQKLILLVLGLVFMQSCNAQGMLVEGEEKTVTSEILRYYLYYPEGYDSNKDKDFGLLLFLHGGGESGGTLDEVKKHGPPKMMAEGYPFPFLVLAPQNPHKKKWWNVHAVNQLLDSVIAGNRVDSDRVYVTGLSRGGSAAWDMAVQYPHKFAALAVVCGMTPTPYAHWLDKEMPIWVFHGADDEVIPVSESDQMVAKLKEMGYDVQYTRYDGVGHNSWLKAYTTKELYDWMNQQERN
ncbi:PHB depolymerase family esterase [Allomuricauda sp. d1]|uniref:carboxylesterase family protein n=1 Tax=Allomuricauda sp. d1 TaxID=3136725 RepID=UPI0031E0A64E